LNQIGFARYLRLEKNLIACDEVSSYGCIADVLAINLDKETIIEYEFKQCSNDLKIAEKRKSKYQMQQRSYKGRWQMLSRDKARQVSTTVLKEPQKPHQFYFVVSEDLYEKEKEYLRSQGSFVGVIVYYEEKDKYYVEKRSAIRKTNLQKHTVVKDNILKRLANVYTWG